MSLPLVLCLAAPILPLLPGSQLWPLQFGFRMMPYILFGLSVIIGLFFTQSRVCYLAILMALVTFLLEGTGAGSGRRSAVDLGTLVVPCVAAVFYHLNERGVLTSYGGRRAATILALGLAVTVLTAIPGFGDAVVAAESHVLRPVSSVIRLPIVGVAVFVCCLPALLIPREHECPALGLLLAMAALLFLGGLNFQSSFWSPDRAPTAFLFSMSAAGLALSWAVLVSAWWHANMDELTELPARRMLHHHFRCLGRDYAIGVLDLDHFKRVNATYGHGVGDQVLRFVGMQLKGNSAGTAYRYGGEEFVIVSETDDFEAAVEKLEDLRHAISVKGFYLRGSDRPARTDGKAIRPAKAETAAELRVTVSMGVAGSSRYRNPKEVMEAADQALYRAKEEGRNRLCVARDPGRK